MEQMALNLVDGLPWTVAVTGGAFLIGAVLGLVIFALRASSNGLVAMAGALYILVFRSVPPIVWIFIVFFGVGSGYLELSPVLSSILALGLISSAYMAEIYRGAFLSIHSGQHEAARALGLSRSSHFIDVVAPQLLRVALPSAVTFLVGLLKDSAIASTIGVPEIAFAARQTAQQTFRGLEAFMLAGLLYMALSIPIAIASRRLDTAFRSRVSR